MEEEPFILLRVPRSVNGRPWRIISGGQTGVDRAALVAAMSYSIPVGGWVPRGRMAEDGIVPGSFYGMRECADGGYRERTRANVRSADATLILSDKLPISGGTAYTAEVAAEIGKPCKVVNLDASEVEQQIRDWMLSLEKAIPKKDAKDDKIVLNVAGPRESVSPGIFDKAKTILMKVFVRFRNWSGGDVCQIDDDGNLLGWIDAECVGIIEDENSGVS